MRCDIPVILQCGMNNSSLIRVHWFQRKTDTIAAVATAAGSAGIGIIRISGENAIAVARVHKKRH